MNLRQLMNECKNLESQLSKECITRAKKHADKFVGEYFNRRKLEVYSDALWYELRVYGPVGGGQ